MLAGSRMGSMMPGAMGVPLLLQMSGIRKSFGGVEVLHGVDFTLRAGEVHALVGENGAGKSTLVRVLGGVHRDHAGVVRVAGRVVRFRGPREAEAAGVALIHQELALIPQLSVAENIFLAREPRTRLGWLARGTMRAAAAATLRDRLGLDVDPDRRIVELPLAVQQLVEIAKALARQARVLVMDEPTSALSEAETGRLFGVVRQLRDRGVGIIYISHKLEEIYALADRITVLRDGSGVGTAAAAELPRAQLLHWMVGRRVEQLYPRQTPPPGAERLSVRGLWLREVGRPRWAVQDVSLSVRAGEIVGLAGLIGSGASELLGAIYGRFGTPERGEVWVDGRRLVRPSPRTALRHGLALLTSDRKSSGLVLPMSVLHNLSLATLPADCVGGLLSGRRERARCAPYVQRLNLRAPSLDAPVAVLSGGNQQKVVLARWLLAQPRMLLLDEPTRGVDVAAKADTYALLNELTAAGLGILLITSELPELIGLADRVVVLHRGRITAELPRAEATQERILRAAMGG